MLKSINLSVSSACGADCIYCPVETRGTRIKEKVMPFELVRKIVDEVASENFSQKHSVERFEVGENGDAFLNRHFVSILRYIREALPNVKVELFTDFQHFTKDKAAIFLREKLVNTYICNIDGANPDDYFAVKRIPYDRVKRNISDFLEIRKALQVTAPLRMQILTADYYTRTIRQHFGSDPVRLTGAENRCLPNAESINLIKTNWRGVLDPEQDRIVPSTSVFAWAERAGVDTCKLNYQNYICPLLSRVKNEAFIAPDGTWYACCYDSNYELALGNVKMERLDEIFSSEKRHQFIGMLEGKEFEKIGGPCRTVNCCQQISYVTPISRAKKALKSISKPLKMFQERL
ncbi:radical SAM/SPASM domain-containing protein [Petrachloros mirabilis]